MAIKNDFSELIVHDNSKIYNEPAFESYKEQMFRTMHYVLPELGEGELLRAINYSIGKRVKNYDCYLDDNYREKQIPSSMIAMTNYILNRKPIITSFGCLFTRHGDVPEPMYQLIQEFSDRRDEYKKEMFKYDKGTELYKRYNLMQVVAKVDNNA